MSSSLGPVVGWPAGGSAPRPAAAVELGGVPERGAGHRRLAGAAVPEGPRAAQQLEARVADGRRGGRAARHDRPHALGRRLRL